MNKNRRMKRMSRHGKRNLTSGLNLVSLMDVFTILVFFLLVNSSSSDVMQPPKNIKLPGSVVTTKPHETVIVMITKKNILVQGKVVMMTSEAIDSKKPVLIAVKDRLLLQRKKIIGLTTRSIALDKEVTLLADRTMPFKLMKKVMSSCASAGYTKISFAVIQKARNK